MMNRLVKWLSTPGSSLPFHCSMLSIIVTAIVMIASGPDMQAVGAFIVPLGLYLVIFAVTAELVYVFRHLVATLTRKRLRSASLENPSNVNATFSAQ